VEAEERETTSGSWEEWKAAAGSLVSSVASLLSIRWSMVQVEAAEWSRCVLWAAAKIALAAALLFFATGLLAAGLVALLAAWFGNFPAAIFAVFGIFVAAAGLLLFSAFRGKRPGPLLEKSVGELAKDLESFSGSAP
jgi:hypothetical protein